MFRPLIKASRPRPTTSTWRRALGWASVGLLVAFHAVLLWQRLVESTLLQPVPAIRWLATVGLAAALYKLHRNGVSLLRGRGAVILWLLVLLLHVSFWGPMTDTASTYEGWSGPGLLLALPALTIILGKVSSVLRRILARLLGEMQSGYGTPVGTPLGSQSFAERTVFLPVLACRPPPLS
jgi:hypothetical protein